MGPIGHCLNCFGFLLTIKSNLLETVISIAIQYSGHSFGHSSSRQWPISEGDMPFESLKRPLQKGLYIFTKSIVSENLHAFEFIKPKFLEEKLPILQT
jgi:hypothetical protein